MRRLWYFWGSLQSHGKLQFIVLVLILAYNFIRIDLNPNIKVLNLPLWYFTVPLILGTILVGRLLLPLMMWKPHRTEQILSLLGILVFALWVYCQMAKRQNLLTYLCTIGGMWLEASLAFWFVSELRLMEQKLVERLMAAAQSHQAEQDDFDDDYEEEDSE